MARLTDFHFRHPAAALAAMAVVAIAALADETVLYEASWQTGDDPALSGWAFEAKEHRAVADPVRGPLLEVVSGHARLHLKGVGGHVVRMRFTTTYSPAMHISAWPFRGDARLEHIPLSGAWTFAHARPDPREVEVGLVLPPEADGLEFRLQTPGRLTAGRIRVVDLGPPPEYQPDGRELLTDPGWEQTPARAAVPRENSYGQHLNGWMGWLSSVVDVHAVTPVPSRVHEGRQAVVVTASGGGIRWQHDSRSPFHGVLHRCYDFSVWAKGQGRLRLYNVNYDSGPDVMVSPDEWRQFHLPMCLDNPTHTELSPGILVDGRVFLDDFSLRQIARAEAPALARSGEPWTAARGPARIVQSVPDGETRSSDPVVLENDHVRATLSPMGGGHVVEYVDKAGAIASRGKLSLLAFSFPAQPVPVDWNLPFRTELSEDGTCVTFSHTITGGEAAPFLDGVRVEQLFSLPANARVLSARFRLRNTAAEVRLPPAMVRSVWPPETGLRTLAAYGSRLPASYILQANAGDAGLFTTTGATVRIEQPIEGWAAACGPGASWVLGFDAPAVKSEQLEPSARAIVWQYPRLTLPPGSVWETEAFLAAAPLDGVVYADRNVVVAAELTPDVGGRPGDFRLTLGAWPPAMAARVKGRIVDYQNRPVAESGPEPGPVVFRPPAGRFITCLDIEPPGAPPYTVELFNDPPDRVVGSGIQGAGQLQYTPGVPARVIRLPDVGDRREVIAAGRTVLWCFGLFSHDYPLETVLSERGLAVERLSEGGGFPEDLEELLAYRLVVMSNIGARHLSAGARAVLSQYVRAGGPLLVLGGSCGLGHAGARGSDLEDLLPAALGGPFEVRPLPGSDNVLRPGDGRPALADLPWSGAPRLYWAHRVTPRPGADILAYAGPVPALLSWNHARGTVVLFAGTVEGDPAPGEMPAWTWPGWTALWGAVVDRWLIPPPPR